MTDFRGMTPEQIRAWSQQQRAASEREFAGDPPPRVSRAKRDEYADFHGVPAVFRVAPEAPVRVSRPAPAGEAEGVVRGLFPVEDGGSDAVVVELAEGQCWALRRADGAASWDPDPETFAVVVEDTHVPVDAWPVEKDGTGPVPAPGALQRWTAHSTSGRGR